ncbi:hypothetical protein J2X69_003153 [Algoriphagus sp. 4150]|uniref:DUF3999 family protein n=1 Tax=Algoriphagus sp. 4150 TaxID=2817756 RepID=UPI00285877B1|nr:DUF3999 family protein [Algoriphagus sp. 4150]MDR7130796.1 hypothetical protein [Algoriphagus sp. 4150]
MKLTIKLSCILLLFAYTLSYGQVEQYNYKRELTGITEQWHSIRLPEEVFGKVSQDLSDIRIFGITATSDTIEAPYLLRLATEKISVKEVAYKTLNTSYNDRGYYFTFEIPTAEPINQINLDFRQSNFDWLISLEGSHNQNDWFTIVEDYRILSIKNEMTDFEFTKLVFPSSKYRFFRLLVNSKEKPELSVASIAQYEIAEGVFRDYALKKFEVSENRKTRETEIDIELQLPVPVSHLKIDVANTFDYYRPVTINYLSDSIRTAQGWKYNYSTLTSGTLNSMENNEFKFSSTTVQKLKILIHNQANQPLTIDKIHVRGYEHELITRFTESATYFLIYGNKMARMPYYDIDRFADKVPETMKTLSLGEELVIEKEPVPLTEPLFKNKVWLWAIMGLIIVLLGWFSIKMIKKN